LDETIKKLVDAIYRRKSTRSFENKYISKTDRQKLEEHIKSIPAILPFEYEANILLGPQDNKKTVFLINTTSSFAAVISKDTIINQAMAGFAGELFVLYCQGIGISTCWIGAFRRNQAESIISGFYPAHNSKEQQKILCLIALGYSSHDKSFLNRFTTKMFSSKRKSVEESLAEGSLKDFPESIRYALELAARAPSASNRQYWYFKVSHMEKQNGNVTGYTGDRYAIEIGRRKEQSSIVWPYPDLDTGIAASHFWLGLKSRDIACSISIKELDGRAVWEFLI